MTARVIISVHDHRVCHGGRLKPISSRVLSINRSQTAPGQHRDMTRTDGLDRIAQIVCTNSPPAFAAAGPSHPPVPDFDLVSCFRGEDMRGFD